MLTLSLSAVFLARQTVRNIEMMFKRRRIPAPLLVLMVGSAETIAVTADITFIGEVTGTGGGAARGGDDGCVALSAPPTSVAPALPSSRPAADPHGEGEEEPPKVVMVRKPLSPASAEAVVKLAGAIKDMIKELKCAALQAAARAVVLHGHTPRRVSAPNFVGTEQGGDGGRRRASVDWHVL